MNSLVGYGVSSESDSDGDGEDGSGGAPGYAERKSEGSAAVQKTRNYLLECGSASSESESEDDPGPAVPSPQPPQEAASSAASRPNLPPPSLGSHAAKKLPSPPLNACSDSSVFANPFKAQADQKLSALQKHVPLTMQAKPSQIGGKRICVSYRKDGRCRFGIKCKFAHDSDLQMPFYPKDCQSPASEVTPVPAPETVGGSLGGESQDSQVEEGKEEESEGKQMKKRKVGLSDTLIPPKRAMKQYAVQRDRERLNMS
ncbi:uncharacterized protein KZ484_024641 [Pholidichthys leucotaenia]